MMVKADVLMFDFPLTFIVIPVPKMMKGFLIHLCSRVVYTVRRNWIKNEQKYILMELDPNLSKSK